MHSEEDGKKKIISLSGGGDAVDAPGLIYNRVRELQLARSAPLRGKSRRAAKRLSLREKVGAQIARQNDPKYPRD